MQTPFDQRENNFDFIRMMLAVLVIFSHSYPLGTGSEAREPFNLLTRGQATGGHIAVDLFFIISGFLITASFERSRTIGSYLKKRVLRIYPGFIVAMLVCALLVVPLSGGHLAGNSAAASAEDVAGQTLRLQEFHYTNVFATNPGPYVVNGSTWSISYEFWCYIGVILLGISRALRSKRVLWCLFLLTIAIAVAFSIYDWKPGGKFLGVIFGFPPFWARLLPMYLAGVVAYRVRSHLTLKPGWIAAACVLLAGAAVLPHGWPLLFPLAGSYLVLVLAFHPGLRLHGWNRFGDFSYGTYLYAFPVQQLVMRWFGHAVSPWTLFAVATPATILCAIASYHLVEKHFLRAAHASAIKPAAEEIPATIAS
jgi:peptidoglycan/LPS O-acetylase OafA/YrhL